MSKIKKHKKAIIIIAIILVAILIIGLIIKKKATKDAYVQPVMDMNMSWIATEGGSDGVLSNEATQEVVLNSGDKIAEVYVTEGQQVKKGDPILSYDTESLKLQLETNKYIGESKEAKLEIAKKELEAYKAIVPVETIPEEPDPVAIISPEQYFPESPAAGSGTADDPYIYVCTLDTIVSGDKLNEFIDQGQCAVFGIYPNGDVTATPEASWNFNGLQSPRFDSDTYYKAVTKELYTPDYYVPESPAVDTYTQAEKDKMISSKTLEISKLETDIKRNKLEQESDKKKLEDAVVVAKIDGTVKYVGDIDNPNTDGSAFVKINNDKGGTLTGYLTEWNLTSVKVGDRVNVFSYETGNSTVAEITEISLYPTDEPMGIYDGSVTSTYPYTAYLSDAEGFHSGENVSVSLMSTEGSAIYLEKIYVRTDDDGQSYCMIDDGNGKLKKQVVTTQKVPKFNEYIMVTDGLSEEDLVAFPYGSTAFEGNTTTQNMPLSLLF